MNVEDFKKGIQDLTAAAHAEGLAMGEIAHSLLEHHNYIAVRNGLSAAVTTANEETPTDPNAASQETSSAPETEAEKDSSTADLPAEPNDAGQADTDQQAA